MSFKESSPQFKMIDVSLIDADPAQPRQHRDDDALKGLANSIRAKGLIHPLVLQPASAGGRHTLIVGERRWRAAVIAGEQTVPAIIRACEPDEALEIQVFENLGLGLRAPLESRDMANAIQKIAERFATPDAAAEHFGRNAAWLNQATAAAKLSAKVSSLLDSGKISSTGAAVQLERLTQKNEVKADALIVQMPEGKKLSRKVVDSALSEESGLRKKDAKATSAASAVIPEAPDSAATIPPWEEVPTFSVSSKRRVSPGKVEQVARILGLADHDEDEVLERLIDAFLLLKGEGVSLSS